MRWIALTAISLLVAGTLRADTIEPFGGEPVSGKVDLEFGSGVFRTPQGAVGKLDFNNIYRIRFDRAGAEECVPGVVLRDGTRLAAPHGPLSEANVQFPKRGISIPAAEVACIIFARFPAALIANASDGQTGALLPGGDFFSGTIRGADAEAVKVFNPIFGLRRLDARNHEVLAAVIRPARMLATQYEFRTADGSLFGADNFGVDRGIVVRHPLYDSLRLASNEVVEIRAGANRCRALATMSQLHAEPAEGLRILPDEGFTADTKTVISCPVPAGFTEFVARVAPGEKLSPGHRVVFTVIANGTPLARSAPQTAGDPPQAMRVALNGARGIVLRVDIAAGPASSVATGRWIQPLFLRR
jgi:hypothetical protein